MAKHSYRGLFGEIVTMAVATLRDQKARSGLTILGVVIGIMSIVGSTSLIRGLDQSLRDTIETMGPDVIMLTKFSAVSLGSGEEFMELIRRRHRLRHVPGHQGLQPRPHRSPALRIDRGLPRGGVSRQDGRGPVKGPGDRLPARYDHPSRKIPLSAATAGRRSRRCGQQVRRRLRRMQSPTCPGRPEPTPSASPSAGWSGPRSGIARLEMPSGIGRDAAVEAADQAAGWLPSFASALHRDARAPVSLTPIAGLERHLHRHQGDARLA